MSLFPADATPPRRLCGAGCGRMLTDPESVRLGFGPCCARRLGLTHSPRLRPRTVRAGGPTPDSLLDLLEDTPMTTELDSADHLALAELDERIAHTRISSDTHTQYAVIYTWRGSKFASGPYGHRPVAEEAAEVRRGLLVERRVQNSYGSWTVTEEAPRG